MFRSHTPRSFLEIRAIYDDLVRIYRRHSCVHQTHDEAWRKNTSAFHVRSPNLFRNGHDFAQYNGKSRMPRSQIALYSAGTFG